MWKWLFSKKRMMREYSLPNRVRNFSFLPEDYKLNIVQDSPDERDYIKVSLPLQVLPISLDYSKYVSVKQQGSLGSCGSFAAVTGFELVENLRSEKLHGIPLSELFHYWMVRQPEYLNTYPDDSGQNGRSAMKVLLNQGVCPERLDPYVVSNFNNRPGIFAFGFSGLWKSKIYQRCVDLEGLKTALYEQNAVWLGIPVQKEIFNCGPSVLSWDPSGEIKGGHAICPVGWDDQKKAIKYVNSWGTGWGDGGFGWLSYDYLTSCPWYDSWSFS